MSRPNLWVVRNSDEKDTRECPQQHWDYYNAVQPELFEDLDVFRIYAFVLSDIDGHSFMKHLASAKPRLIVDIRPFPSFFGIFHSTKDAIYNFKNSSINYIHAANRGQDFTEIEANIWSTVKLASVELYQKFPASSVFFLTRNRDQRDLVLQNIKSLFAQDLNSVKLLHLP